MKKPAALFLSQTDAAKLVGLSTATLAREEKEGRFPPRRQLTMGRTAFLASEVYAWVEMRERVNSVAGDRDKGSARLFDTLKEVLEVLLANGWRKEDLKFVSSGIMRVIFDERLRKPAPASGRRAKCA